MSGNRGVVTPCAQPVKVVTDKTWPQECSGMNSVRRQGTAPRLPEFNTRIVNLVAQTVELPHAIPDTLEKAFISLGLGFCPQHCLTRVAPP